MAGARAFHKAPRQIAQAIVDHLNLEGSLFDRVEIAGPGFINFYLSVAVKNAIFGEAREKGMDFAKSNVGGGLKTQVEFVSANPVGPMHIGHGRWAALGDSLCTGKKRRFPGIPMFAPEFFARVSSIDSLKRKQFVKGVLQLSEEGAIQTFKRPGIGFEEIIVGVVGVLQFEVLEHRLKTEYNAEIRRQQLPYRFVRWITKSPKAIEDLKLSSTSSLAKDARERDVILFENEWSIRWALENNEGLELAETASRLG